MYHNKDSVLLSWEKKNKLGILYSLFNTLKNSFQFSNDFSKEVIQYSSIWNSMLYATLIFFIANTFLMIFYLLVGLEEFYKIFSILIRSLISINFLDQNLELFKIFIFFFPFLQSFLLLFEAILTSFFLYLILIFTSKNFQFISENKTSQKNSLNFTQILNLNLYTKGSYLLIVFPGFIFKLIAMFISIYLLIRFLFSILGNQHKIISLYIILANLTSLLWVNIFIKILSTFLKNT